MEPEPLGFSNIFFPYFSDPILLMVGLDEVIISSLLIFLLLICSALISGSEVAFFALTHNDIEALKKENGDSPASKRVVTLMERPAYLLATILITNNFINIGIIILSNVALAPLQSLLTADFGFVIGLADIWNTIIGIFNKSISYEEMAYAIFFFFSTLIVTFLLVLFGEVSPKLYANINSLKLSKLMSKTLLTMRWIFYYLSSILVNSSTFLEKRLTARAGGNKFSASEIDQAIALTVSREKGSEREVDILRSIVQFNNIAVKQIMRSRMDVKALDFALDFKEVITMVKEWGFSRVPVFDEDFDNVTGILHVKDLLGYLNEPEDFEWQAIIRPNVMYIPESKKISELLNEFQEKRTHMAIVVDEYGGSSGIVTLEDVMEEVIGEIRDEFDTQREIDFHKINAYTYIFEGKTMLHDISKLLGIDLDVFEEVRGEADSLAGLLLEMYGFIPAKGSTISFKKYTFEVVSSTKKRIERIKLVLPN